MVKERMRMDFLLMQKLAAFADKTPSMKWMNLGPSMEQFSHTMTAQVYSECTHHTPPSHPYLLSAVTLCRVTNNK